MKRKDRQMDGYVNRRTDRRKGKNTVCVPERFEMKRVTSSGGTISSRGFIQSTWYTINQLINQPGTINQSMLNFSCFTQEHKNQPQPPVRFTLLKI